MIGLSLRPRHLALQQRLGESEQQVGEQCRREDAHERRHAGRQIGGLGIATGEVPDEHEDEGAQSERLHERDGHQGAGEEAKDGAHFGAAQQRDADDDDEREIGVGAEDADVRRHRGLQQHRGDQDDREAREVGAGRQHPSVLVGGGATQPHLTTTWTRSSLRKSTNGLTAMLW
jgi:hypothetical protein